MGKLVPLASKRSAGKTLKFKGEDVVIQPSEIERFIWADYSLAIKTFKFTNDKKVLTQAKSWLIEQLY